MNILVFIFSEFSVIYLKVIPLLFPPGEFNIDVKKFEENSQQYVTMTASVNNLTNRVTLGVVAKVTDGLILTVYSSYWMVNCTGKQLHYQGKIILCSDWFVCVTCCVYCVLIGLFVSRDG